MCAPVWVSVCCSLHLQYVAVTILCDVRPVNGLWVQSGDGRPDGDVKCAIGTERAQSLVDTSDPASYLKAASLR